MFDSQGCKRLAVSRGNGEVVLRDGSDDGTTVVGDNLVLDSVQLNT